MDLTYESRLGVSYCRSSHANTRNMPPRLTEYKYKWLNVTTGKTGVSVIWCDNYRSVMRLCAMWSSEMWWYTPCDCVELYSDRR